MDKVGCIENNDIGALTTEQQSKLNEFKVIIRSTLDLQIHAVLAK